MAEEKRDPLEYVINRMENAGQSNAPAANGYGRHRKDLLDAIVSLRAEVQTYKRIAERNHRANLMPCPKCGYRQAEIKAKESHDE